MGTILTSARELSVLILFGLGSSQGTPAKREMRALMICKEGGVIKDVAGASPQDTFGGSPRSIVLNRAVMWQNRVSIALQGQFRRGRVCCSAGGDRRVAFLLAAASPSADGATRLGHSFSRLSSVQQTGQVDL